MLGLPMLDVIIGLGLRLSDDGADLRLGHGNGGRTNLVKQGSRQTMWFQLLTMSRVETRPQYDS